MELEQENVKIPVLVREISYCGFSFINLSKSDVDIKKAFVLNLMERDGDRAYSIGKFVGKVHRVQEVDGGKTVYGCILADKHAAALQKYIDEGRMPGVPQDRWEKSIRPVLDRLFVASNQGMGGTIVGVAEDGKDTWTSVDGKVLPTDPKLRQKYEKKDKTYLDYVSE